MKPHLRRGALEILVRHRELRQHEIAGREPGQRLPAQVHDHLDKLTPLRMLADPPPHLLGQEGQEAAQLDVEVILRRARIRGARGGSPVAGRSRGEAAAVAGEWTGGEADGRGGQRRRGSERGWPRGEVDGEVKSEVRNWRTAHRGFGGKLGRGGLLGAVTGNAERKRSSRVALS